MVRKSSTGACERVSLSLSLSVSLSRTHTHCHTHTHTYTLSLTHARTHARTHTHTHTHTVILTLTHTHSLSLSHTHARTHTHTHTHTRTHARTHARTQIKRKQGNICGTFPILLVCKRRVFLSMTEKAERLRAPQFSSTRRKAQGLVRSPDKIVQTKAVNPCLTQVKSTPSSNTS